MKPKERGGEERNFKRSNYDNIVHFDIKLFFKISMKHLTNNFDDKFC